MTTKQDCASCSFRSKCWDSSQAPDDSTLAINLLVCRIKLGIKVNASAKLLLRLLRPKSVKLADWIRKTVYPIPADVQDLVAEIESVTIELILTKYDLGGRSWVLPYLYGKPKGGVYLWALKRANQLRREAATHISCDVDANFAGDLNDFENSITALNYTVTGQRIQSSPLPIIDHTTDIEDRIDASRAPDMIQATIDRVDDGVTLSLQEYRTMRFCLNHAGTMSIGRPSPVSGLQGFLTEQSGYSRKAINRSFRTASYKLIEVAGATAALLKARGIEAEGVRSDRRRRWILGVLLDDDKLTDAEIHGLLNTATALEDSDVTLIDVCWAYGVTDKTYRKLRERYGTESSSSNS